MIDDRSESKQDIPSRRVGLLTHLAGAKILNLVRRGWWPPVEAAVECAVSDDFVFSLTAGPLDIYLENGWVIGVSSDPSLISVVLWSQRDPQDPSKEYLLDSTDQKFHSTEANDPRFSNAHFKAFIGSTISGLTILRRAPVNALWHDLPCEAGLILDCGQAGELILSHGLHNDSDDFSVLIRSQIRPNIEFE